MSAAEHVKNALRRIEGLHDYQSEEGLSDASMLTVAIEAQALATLALVEQQRIANLIAAAGLIPEGARTGVDAWGADSGSVIHSRLADSDTWLALLGERAAKREGMA